MGKGKAKVTGVVEPVGTAPPPMLVSYGRTNTFLVRGKDSYLLVDTDYAGTLSAFFRAIKRLGVRVEDISFLLATHYHPDHCGLAGELQTLGVTLLLMESQVGACRYAEEVFRRGGLDFAPVDEGVATVIAINESRRILSEMGIAGEVLSTPSHSPDSVSVALDNGYCLVGDLVPESYLFAYGADSPERLDWERVTAVGAVTICHAHGPAFRDRLGGS